MMTACPSDQVMIEPAEIAWKVCGMAQSGFSEVRSALGDVRFHQWQPSLKNYLCAYFSAQRTCQGKLGKSISPVRSGVPHGKGLKVRFAFPGCGKSGGLRLAVLAFCEGREVRVAGAWKRSDDPDDGDLEAAFAHHDK